MLTTTSFTHTKLVELTAAKMVNEGFIHVRASHIDRFTACDQIGDFIPDTTALAGAVFVIAEAESHEGLVDAHTEAQWNAFYNYANRLGGHFIAVVNKADETAARTLLMQVCGNVANAHIWAF